MCQGKQNLKYGNGQKRHNILKLTNNWGEIIRTFILGGQFGDNYLPKWSAEEKI